MLTSHRISRAICAFALILSPIVLNGQTLVATIQTSPQPPLTNPNQMILNAATNKVYVAGDQGHIDILNASTNKRIGFVTPPTTDAVIQFFANPTNGRTYALTANTIFMIDGAADTVTQTLSVPQTTFVAADYIPATDRFYVSEATGATNQVVVLDGTTLTQVAVLLSGSNANLSIPQVPTMLVAVPAKNQIFGFFPGASSGSIWVWDGSNNSIIDQTSCPAACTRTISGHIAQAVLNPIDNSVWTVTYFQQASAGGGDEGSGPALFPFRTVITRVNLPLSPLSLSFQFFGAMAISGFDPSGKIVGFANCVPTVPNPAASTAPCLNTLSGLFAIDEASPIGVDSPITNLTSFTGVPGTTAPSMCSSTLVQGSATIPIGYDPDLGNAYWSCNGTGIGPVSDVAIVKYNLAQPVDTSVFPPQILGQWVTALPTHALHQPTLITVMTTNHASHRAFFPNALDNAVMSVDPVGSTLVTELLSTRPATLAVNPTTNTVYLAEDTGAQITTVNGATNTVTALHTSVGSGPFVAVNPNTSQVILAGATDTSLDPGRSTGAFLYDATATTQLHALSAAAAGGFTFDPSTVAGQGADVNPVTNRGYFLDQNQWYVVDLATGNRLFTGYDFSGGSVPNQCLFSGMAVNSKTNQYYIMGQCPASVNAPYNLGVFDGNTNAPVNVVALEIFNVGNGGGWRRIAVNPNTNRLYLESISVPTVALAPNIPIVISYDATTLTRVDSPNTSAGPVSFPLAINTATNRVYASIFSTSSPTTPPQMVLLDGSVDAFGRTDVVLGMVPNMLIRGITVNPATGLAYVASDTLLPLPGQPAASGPGLNVFQEPPVPPKFSISGVVTKGGAPAPGIGVAIDDSNFGGKLVVTDATGAYSLSGVPAGNYSVQPNTRDFIYTPASQTVTIVNANITGVNFSASPAFTISGRVVDGNGNGIAGQNVQVEVSSGTSTQTDATGAFTLTNFVPGTYTIGTGGTACCFFPQTVTVTSSDITGVIFNELPPVGVSGLSFNLTLIGANVVTTGTVTLSGPAPAGGIVVQIQNTTTVVKAPSSVTVPAGAKSATFTVQASGVNVQTTLFITAIYSGPFSLGVTDASVLLTVDPVDSLKVTSATWSKSTQLLTVNATSTNPQSTLNLILSSNNAALGTMVNQGGGKFTFQAPFTTGTPAAIGVKSTLGGSTGQGVSVIP
jgi:hypothetical protein